MSYDWITKTLVLIDSAYVKYDDVQLYGDTIYFYPDQKIIDVRGNMKLIQGTEEVTGDNMIFNISTNYGSIDEGRTHIPEGYFTGDEIRQVRENLWHVSDGTFTTCDRNDYYFWGSRMIIEHDNMLIAEPVILYIGNVPVMALPWWFFPIKKGRHSGFLFPKFGNSSTDGKYVKKLAYYWAINDYSEATFSLDIMEKKGVGFNFDGLYLIKPYLNGNINAQYIREIDTGVERWRLFGSHRHQVNSSTSLYGRVDWQSDKKYRIDYGEDVLVDLNKKTSSFLSLSKNWNFIITQILVLRQEDLLSNTVHSKIPEITYSIPSRRIFSRGHLSRSYYSIRGSYSTDEYSDSLQTYKTYNTSNVFSLQNPFNIFRFISVNPSLTLKASANSADTTANINYNRHWSFSLSTATFIYGLSNFSLGNIKRFRHVINPVVSYQYSPPVYAGVMGDSSYTYEIGTVTSRLNLRLNQNLQLKWIDGKGERKFDFLSFALSSSYDFMKTDSNWADINVSVDLKPFNNFTFRSQFLYDPYSLVRKSSTHTLYSTFSGTLPDFIYSDLEKHTWSTYFNYSYSKNQTFENQQLWGSLGLDLTDNWKLTYSARWDLNEGHMINQSLALYRDMHCWEAMFNWQKFGNRWSYSFTIRIKDIHDIRVIRDMVRLIIPRI